MTKKDKHKSIIKCRAKNGLRTIPTTCNYCNDGKLIACVCRDGSILVWDTRKPSFVNATLTIRDGHLNNSDTSSIVFSYRDTLLCTRGEGIDETLKLWDIRAFKKPIHVVDGLYSRYVLVIVLIINGIQKSYLKIIFTFFIDIQQQIVVLVQMIL